MRLRPSLLICAGVLAALLAPTTASAGSGGAAAPAPGQSAAGSGGTAVGAPVPSSTERTRKRAQRKQVRKHARKQVRRPVRRQRKRRRPVPPRPTPVPAPVPAPSADVYVFPVAGPYTVGDEGAKFGAPRSGHRHMGHDIAAARGTPVVAPYPGAIAWVRFQRSGAGHYVVLDADDGRDYVFMHLRRGSIPVVQGQRVAAGEKLGEVGNSGRSVGAHLHFEVWVGGWYEPGGEAIDPLPLLEAWAR